MKSIWNTFCKQISKNKGVKEMTFEKEIVKGFLQALGWSLYSNNLVEQQGLYSRKWIPDFIFYLNGDEKAQEIILELKKPDHKQRKVDIEQIEAYMKLADCRFGLYFGEKLEVFYLLDKGGKRSAESVITIDWTLDNESGVKLIELLDFKHYDRQKLEKFCRDHVNLNFFIRQWKTSQGQQKLYDGIIEHFMLSPSISGSLQSILKFSFGDNPETGRQYIMPNPVVSTSLHEPTGKVREWLICYDINHFDVEACFKKYGQIYWLHRGAKKNVKMGDIAYLYSNSPERAIRYMVEVVDSQIPYSPEMDVEDEFSKDGCKNSDDSGETFFLVRPIAETHSPALKLSAMISNGVIGKRATTTILTKEEYRPLKEYIERHFYDAAPVEEIVTPAPKKKGKQPLDRTQYSLDGVNFTSKATFVPSAVKAYAHKHNLTIRQIKKKFPDSLLKGFKRLGFICTKDELEKGTLSNNRKPTIKEISNWYHPDKNNAWAEDREGVEYIVCTEITKDSADAVKAILEADGFTIFTKPA